MGPGEAAGGGRRRGGGGAGVDHRRQGGAHRRVDRGAGPRDRAALRSGRGQGQAPCARHVHRPRALPAARRGAQAQGRAERRREGGGGAQEEGSRRRRRERGLARRARGCRPAARGGNHGARRARVLHERLGEAGRNRETVRGGPQGGFGVEQTRLAFPDAEGVPRRAHASVADGTAPGGRCGDRRGGAGAGPRGRATQGGGGARRRRRRRAEGRHRRREEPGRRRRRWRRRRRLPGRAHRARAPAEGPAAKGHRPDGARGDHDGDVQARAPVPGAQHREGQAEGGGAQKGGRARGRGAAEAGGHPRRAPAASHGGHPGALALRHGFGFPQRGARRVPRARAHRPRAARRRRLRGDYV